MKTIFRDILCLLSIATTVPTFAVGLVDFKADGPVLFEGIRRVSAFGISGVTTVIALEDGDWRVQGRALKVRSGQIVSLGELDENRSDPAATPVPAATGKLQLKVPEKMEWRLFGEEFWRVGPGETVATHGAHGLEWRINNEVSRRLLVIEKTVEINLPISISSKLSINSNAEGELITGPARQGGPQIGDVAVLKNESSEITGWRRLQKANESVSATPSVPHPLLGMGWMPAGAIARLSNQLQSGAVGDLLDLPLSESVYTQFCYIPSGKFTMGSPSSEKGHSTDEEQVKVTLSQAFWLAKTEVTQEQWQALMGSNPSQFKGEQLPIENVSWEDAQSFLTRLNESKVLPEVWQFALPTEAQWEYACRAGEKGPYSGGSLNEVGWYDGNSEKKPHDVGLKMPNAWGLHDMHGNVYEWCADGYADPLQGGVDPERPELGDERVCRGGSWFYNAVLCRAANRYKSYPDRRDYRLGFRLAIVPSK
jgi:formylglycine-generating enzyme required for sulfatase activity